MAYTTINKNTDHFKSKLYTGTGSNGNAITGVGFQPDLIWIKDRINQYSHRLYDVIRGVNSALNADQNAAESQYAAYGQLESIDSDGFTVGQGSSNGAAMNDSGDGHVAWCWKANGAGSSNTDGSITSTVSANTTAGFSIVKYVGTGSGSNSTVGHGLGVKPAMIIVKNLDSTGNWVVWHKHLASETNNYLRLDTDQAPGTTTNYWNSAAPTNQVFGVSPDGYNNNKSGEDIIAYCFAEKQGYSKFGTYVGNSNSDGQFVYTGFKVSFLMVKPIGSTADNWVMFDNARLGYNPDNNFVYANKYFADNDSNIIDFVSNGFKMRDGGNTANRSEQFIYMAFGQSLVGTNNIPCTAR